jgi:hypothetical protein
VMNEGNALDAAEEIERLQSVLDDCA